MVRKEQLANVIAHRTPLYSPDFPLILMWSQKAGCTVLSKWFFFQVDLLQEALSYNNWIHAYENRVFKKHLEVYTEDVLYELEKKQKTTIKLVRNPFARAVSGFIVLGLARSKGLNHWVHNEWRNLRKFCYGDVASNKGISFREFLVYLQTIGCGVGEINAHLAKQYVVSEEFVVDKILHVEELPAAVRRIEAAFDLKPSPVDIFNSGHHRRYSPAAKGSFADVKIIEDSFVGMVPPAMQAFYNKETQGLVGEVFSPDFENYGYSLDRWVDT